jgi:catechol 2,3-dioxygenase-like lactoylglutathione lyase family enzyme
LPGHDECQAIFGFSEGSYMKDCTVTGLRSIELGVTELERATKFYSDAWGLELVAADGDTRYFRGNSTEHHVVSLKEVDAAVVLGITLAAPDEASIDRLYAEAPKAGITVLEKPRQLPAAAGGGYGLVLEGPEHLQVTVSCGVAQCPQANSDHSKPYNLTHVVLNSADVPKQIKFFCDFLGFRISDSTARMEFMRCGSDHHSIALAYGDSLSLNHAAFEMENIDGLMYGAGRLIEYGYPIEWGLGRHGPGNNVFSYFIDPDGFVVEYTTEMQQIDENSYQAQDSQYWAAFPKRPCRWGVARKPSDRLMASMSGKNLARAKTHSDSH